MGGRDEASVHKLHTVLAMAGRTPQSRYFKSRLDELRDEAFELLRRLQLASGSFEAATRQSLPQYCQTMRALTDQDNAALELAALVTANLTPDLRTPEWLALRSEGTHPLTGYCYVASEAMYPLMGGAEAGWRVFRCELPGGGSHWWLTGRVDPLGTKPGKGLEAPPLQNASKPLRSTVLQAALSPFRLLQEALGTSTAVRSFSQSRLTSWFRRRTASPVVQGNGGATSAACPHSKLLRGTSRA